MYRINCQDHINSSQCSKINLSKIHWDLRLKQKSRNWPQSAPKNDDECIYKEFNV